MAGASADIWVPVTGPGEFASAQAGPTKRKKQKMGASAGRRRITARDDSKKRGSAEEEMSLSERTWAN